MPVTTYILTFNEPINVSVQVGDIIYYASSVNTSGTVDPMSWDTIPNVIQFGKIQQITNQYGSITNPPTPITIRVASAIPPPGANDFIMFGKDKTANTSSLIGYYAKVNFVNDSTEKAELFSVGSEVFESSK
jgi:hypothetical protein